MALTKEDQQIARRVSKHLRTWDWGDYTAPSQVSARMEYATAVTGSRKAIGHAYLAKQTTVREAA